MTMPARLKSHLDQIKIPYSQISHIPTYTAQGAASVMHVPGKEVAKTVVVRAGEKTLLAVLPASFHVNLNKLASIVGCDVRLATESECYALFPDCEPGAVPPFGELYGLPVYMDEALADDPEIILSVGTHSDAIRMGNADFVHLAKPQICSFADGTFVANSMRCSTVCSVNSRGEPLGWRRQLLRCLRSTPGWTKRARATMFALPCLEWTHKTCS